METKQNKQLPASLQKIWDNIFPYAFTFGKWLLFGTLTGILCGVVGSLFAHTVSKANHIRSMYPQLIYFLPIAGLVIVASYRFLGIKQDRGTNLVLSSIRTEESVPIKLPFLIFLATGLTHLFGGSAGREGAALQIGGGIGSSLSNFLHFKEKDKKLMTMCGMSAVFSALFGTPLTATIFSMEVVSVGVFHYSAFMPCLISSIIAYGVSQFLHVPGETYIITEAPAMSIHSLLLVIIFSVLLALLSIVFCVTMHKSSHFAKKHLKNPYIRIIVGGCMIVVLTLLIGNQNYNGAGAAMIEHAIEGHAKWYDFFFKLLFTAITLGFGYKGGEIVPSFFIGSTFGAFMGPLLGLPAPFAAACGMIGVFCGAVNCPIASIILSIELFGSDNLLLFAVVCSISYLLSGSYSLYSSQKLMYSKLKPEFIDRLMH